MSETKIAPKRGQKRHQNQDKNSTKVCTDLKFYN
jgi:hypothetical protein